MNDILNVIYTSGKQMETKPSLYEIKMKKFKGPILFVLESRYDGAMQLENI